MSTLWRTDVLCSAMSGRPVGVLPEGVSGISIDSRTLQPGEAFFAIKGDLHDGHDFATAAIKAGAGVLVVSEGRLPALGRITAPLIVVPDVLVALEAAGVAARARSRAKIIAITGSAGKTSTKEALRCALAACGKVHASDKSFNNHWGVPLTLARMPEECDYAVFEIGMNHPGEIRPLVKLVRPHIGIVTLIAAAHLGHFASLEEIAEAKAEIFEGIEPGGHALINRDDVLWSFLDKAAHDAGVEHVWGFGEHARATFRLAEFSAEGSGSRVIVKMAGRQVSAHIGAPGRHVAQNVLAVLGASYLAGADLEKAATALARFKPEAGRGKQHRLAHPAGGQLIVIDESYNANPASVKAALDLLREADVPAEGRRIAVLGDMLELGAHSRQLHESLAVLVEQAQVDLALLAGGEMSALAQALPESIPSLHHATADELMPVLLDTVRPGDVVMIKSSNSIGFSKLVAALLKRFPAAAQAMNTNGHVN